MSQFGLIGNSTEPEDDDRRPGKFSGPLSVMLALLVVLGVGLLLFLGGRAVVGWISDLFDPPPDYPGPGTGSVVITVEPGDTPTDVSVDLFTEDVVASQEAFIDAAKDDPRSSEMQPGAYEMQRQMAAEDALEILVDPTNRITNEVTIREGLREEDVLATFSAASGTPLGRWEEAASKGNAIGLPNYAGGDAEGYLFPATYELEPGDSQTDTLRATTTRFKEMAEEVALVPGAEQIGMGPGEVVTIASIVQAETGPDEADLGKIARVIYNRLAMDLPLQMDSTVAYAVGESTVFVTEEEKAVDSPYNTYLYTGLPPGPIGNPGQAAVEAALNPTPGDWLYFVTVNLDTGETKYATTLEEHEQNVAELEQWLEENPS